MILFEKKRQTTPLSAKADESPPEQIHKTAAEKRGKSEHHKLPQEPARSASEDDRDDSEVLPIA